MLIVIEFSVRLESIIFIVVYLSVRLESNILSIQFYGRFESRIFRGRFPDRHKYIISSVAYLSD